MVLLRYNRRSSIPIRSPQSGMALRYLIQHSILPFLSVLLLLNGWSSIPSSTSIRSTCISFQTRNLPPLPAMLSMDGLLRWIGAPRPGFVPFNFVLHSSITIITPLAHPALPIRHSSFPGGASLFSTNSSYCLTNSILNHHELTSQYQLFRYHKSSQTTLEFNVTHSPGLNHSEIQGAPPASCTIDELCVPAFVSPDETGDLVDDIEAMFD